MEHVEKKMLDKNVKRKSIGTMKQNIWWAENCSEQNLLKRKLTRNVKEILLTLSVTRNRNIH